MNDTPAADEALAARAARLAERSGCAVQVAVGHGGGLLAQRSFGRARSAGGREWPADERTLFCVFSVTKTLVSAAAWILLQEGRVRLEGRVASYVPGFEANGKSDVTIEHLLTHSAGFPGARLRRRGFEDPAARTAEMAGWTLEWEPGSRFVYHASSGMWALAEVITRVGGAEYREFVRARILAPLGLEDDFFLGLPAAENARVADVELVGEAPDPTQRGQSPVDAPALDAEMVRFANDPRARAASSPGGGAIATAGAVARLYQAFLADAAGRGPGLWDPAVLRDAWTPRAVERIDPMTRQPALRGLGVVVAGESGRIWRGFPEACSPRAFGHMGAGGQVSWADPESGLSFALLTSGAERDPLRQGANGLALSSLAAACRPPG